MWRANLNLKYVRDRLFVVWNAILTIIKYLYDLSGARSVWERVYPPLTKHNVRPASSIAFWVVGIYLTVFGIASQRYENFLDRLENRVTAVISQSAIDLVPSTQAIAIPVKPTFNIINIYDSLFGEFRSNDDAIRLLGELVVSKKNILDDANLTKVILDRANLSFSKMFRARLDNSQLIETDFSYANLVLSDFSDTIALKANFTEAKLREANFNNAVLTNAAFVRADLSDANLYQATINGASFDGAYLGGATWIDGKRCNEESYGTCIIDESSESLKSQKLKREVLKARVIDVGGGLSVLITIPDTPFDHHVLYDVGKWKGHAVSSELQKLLKGTSIDLLILSHGDADHLGEIQSVLENIHVKRVLRTGQERTGSQMWSGTNEHIRNAHSKKLLEDLNMKYLPIKPGWELKLGEAKITLMSGFYKTPNTWEPQLRGQSEQRNAGGIVLMIQYHGRSILLTGDMIGRDRQDADNVRPKLTEKYLIDNIKERPIATDVLIAPYHGSNRASTTAFIKEVSPGWVIFSAGNKSFGGIRLPLEEVINRYRLAGIEDKRIFQTNRCLINVVSKTSQESNPVGDGMARYKSGENHVDISITRTGSVEVRYANECPREKTLKQDK